MCRQIENMARDHQLEEQRNYDEIKGKLAGGFSGNKPLEDKLCKRQSSGTHEKRGGPKVNREDLDEMGRVLSTCQEGIKSSLDGVNGAKHYNDEMQELWQTTEDPVLHKWHPQHFLPAISTAIPICKETLTSAVTPVDLPPPPPIPTTDMPSRPSSATTPHVRSNAAAVVKRDPDDTVHKEAVEITKKFMAFLSAMTESQIMALRQCRRDKNIVLMQKFDEHYERKEELATARASIKTLNELAQKTFTKTITETSEAKPTTASDVKTTVTTTVTSIITASASERINTQGVNKAVTTHANASLTSTVVGIVPASKDKPTTINPGGESGSMVPAAMVSVPASKSDGVSGPIVSTVFISVTPASPASMSDVSPGPIFSTVFISVTPSSQLVKSPEPSSSASTPTTSEAKLVATIPTIPTA